MTGTPRLAAEDLSVEFTAGRRRVRAVRAVSFAVPPGTSFGIVGESGSGKSTVLRAIAGLVSLSAGRVALDGKALGAARDPTFRRTVQMVFQDPYASLHPRHTVDRVLAEPLAIHRFDRREARIAEVLDAVGLGSSFRFRLPHQMSGGQRQRVAIARALILEPSVLLLDEPTSALDASIQAEILNLLNRLRRERALTFVMVSHDLAVIDHMCDTVMVMRGGTAVERLSAAKLAKGEVESDYTRLLLKAAEGFAPVDVARREGPER